MRRRKLWSINCLLIVIILSSIIPIRVFAKKDGYSNAKPRLVVDSFKVSEDAIVPGEDFELELVLSNPGRVYSINNIVLTFTNDEETVMPVYPNSDQVYIESIGPGKKQTVKIHLIAADEIKTETVKFTINALYSDGESTTNLNTTSISLPVTRSSKFEIQNVSIPDEVYTGAKTRAHITYKNSGADNFYNVTMYIEGSGLDSIQQYSLGSLIAGKISYAEAYIEFKNQGSQSVEIYFTYEDIKGNKYTSDSYEADVRILENNQKVNTEGAYTDQIIDNKRDYIGKLVLIAGIAVMGILVLILARKYKR